MAESNSQQVSVERIIDAPAEQIFAVISDPRRHPEIDGSGTVRDSIKGPERLQLGSKFSMDMKLGVPYRMANTVVEFEQDRLIAWHHYGRHRWRYELEPLSDGRTLVRETFDWSTARIPKVIELMGAPARNEPGMVKTLERLAALVEGQDPSHG